MAVVSAMDRDQPLTEAAAQTLASDATSDINNGTARRIFQDRLYSALLQCEKAKTNDRDYLKTRKSAAKILGEIEGMISAQGGSLIYDR